ncbi:ABC-type multidrug transport system, ATPase and permease component [Pustulibacterium marinum]|uniref:ABC-type multidrug transport system, ATPase and permease component n=1 Tax=Pustulibacterium marinum TaxID=1224947 RepID=A0A1I7FDW9_9FLAO|nr:ABC transporter ATP-binding protein [Pustulibacterium marinum]SFU34341.1 ABC-type multidrug transport system, ATPase and permease component [Pustulibacterium marinum]
MSKENTGKAFDLKLIKRLVAYTKPYKATYYFVVISAILLAFLAVARPYMLKTAVNDYITDSDEKGLLLICALMLGVLLVEVTMQWAYNFYANLLAQDLIKDIRIKLFQHMLRFKMKYYDKSSVGVLVTRTVQDMERIGEIFSNGFFQIISDFLKIFVIAAVMLFSSWKLTLIVFSILPIILYATYLFQKAMKKAFVEVRREVSNLNSFVQERITGMKILQIFTREKEEYKQFKAINERHKKSWVATVWYNSIFLAVIELVSSATIGLVVWFGGLDAVKNGATIGDIFMFIQLTQMLFRPLRQIADKFNGLQMGMVAAGRVFAILDTESSIDNKGTLEASEIKGAISFDKVHFGYTEKEEVLHGISFDVHVGETVAIVGATGAGKSTIINLLNRFYEIQSGEIKIDNTNIDDFTLTSLRSNIAIVLQDVFLFADSILNNITLKNEEIKEEDVIAAAKDIGVHDFINTLPGGYHYNVKERGTMLSSGQRQLIAFLRAYVSNPSILILDEATSSVDSYSEMLIQEATEKITEGRTSIVIAHRLATIKKASKILVMDSGTIVESGTHEELLEKENGYYRNLYEVQFMAEERRVS